MKNRKIALFCLLVLVVVGLCRWAALHSAKWALSTDTDIAREEILMLTPRGTDIGHARAAMEKAGFRCKLQPNAPFSWGMPRPRGAEHIDYPRRDYLYCDRETREGQRWQVAVTYREGRVTDVFVSYSFGVY